MADDPRDRFVQPLGDVDRDQLILDHLPLLHHIVGRMALDVPGSVEREDLVGFGMLGLVEASDTWDPSRGLKFSTFAFPRIRGAILDELRRMDFLPRGRREKVRKLDAAVRRLEQEAGLPPTPEQIATELGVELVEVDEVLQSARVAGTISLDDGPSDELASLLEDPKSEDPVGSAEWNEMRGMLARLIDELPDQERHVITLYYAEELLLREIGEVLGITESRVSQIHGRALYRLNRTLKSHIGTP
jgi:RNA polymerase sigma factor for flagellar operon FliA